MGDEQEMRANGYIEHLRWKFDDFDRPRREAERALEEDMIRALDEVEERESKKRRFWEFVGAPVRMLGGSRPRSQEEIDAYIAENELGDIDLFDLR